MEDSNANAAMGEARNINAVIEVKWESKSTRLRPFAQSIPLPLFPSKCIYCSLVVNFVRVSSQLADIQ